MSVCDNFNSIKVRLKRTAVRELDLADKFQFHKGTIKTWQMMRMHAWMIYFNSIKVRLKPCHRPSYTVLPLNFNSIKVRLKPDFFKKNNLPDKFQFHKGTIKTKWKSLSCAASQISIP